jgi:hypothetical protein
MTAIEETLAGEAWALDRQLGSPWMAESRT